MPANRPALALGGLLTASPGRAGDAVRHSGRVARPSSVRHAG